jgi:hypothetical protein
MFSAPFRLEDKMSLPRFYIASDYAGIKTSTIDFYYGYEVVNDKDEWCFQVKRNNMVYCTIPLSKLEGIRDDQDCGECLLSGIMQLIQDGKLILKP